jgi:hypothetical protein
VSYCRNDQDCQKREQQYAKKFVSNIVLRVNMEKQQEIKQEKAKVKAYGHPDDIGQAVVLLLPSNFPSSKASFSGGLADISPSAIIICKLIASCATTFPGSRKPKLLPIGIVSIL